jgi:hypothetical protein
MNMTTKAALAAVALAAGMFTSSAQATDYDLNSLVVDWTAGVDKAFTGGAGTFVDHYTFTTDGSGYLTDSLLQQLGISITSFSIHNAASNARRVTRCRPATHPLPRLAPATGISPMSR